MQNTVWKKADHRVIQNREVVSVPIMMTDNAPNSREATVLTSGLMNGGVVNFMSDGTVTVPAVAATDRNVGFEDHSHWEMKRLATDAWREESELSPLPGPTGTKDKQRSEEDAYTDMVERQGSAWLQE